MAIGEHKSYALESSKSCPASCSNRRQRVKIVGTGETILMRARQGDLKSRPAKRRGRIGPPQRGLRQRDWVPVEIHGTEGALAVVRADPRQATYIEVSEFTVRGAQAGKPLADLSISESYRRVPAAVPAGLPFNVAQLYRRMAEGIREGKSASPDFDLAVKRHQLLDAIQKASDTGIRQIL